VDVHVITLQSRNMHGFAWDMLSKHCIQLTLSNTATGKKG